MQKSESIAALAAALAKAQAAMRHAAKDASNPHFRSKYADLPAVVEAIREPFGQHGLSYVQGNDIADGQGVIVETMLLHESGEWLQSRLFVPVTKWDAQGIGSAITYGRRYSLMAIAGLAADDDDGEAAVGRHAAPRGPAAARPPAPEPRIDAEQAASLQALADEVGADVGKMLAFFHVASFAELPAGDYARAVQMLEKKRKQGAA